MRIALTGASGIIGQATARHLTAQGHHVTALDRAHGWSLGLPAPLAGHDVLIHCAFAHVPGRYRGGEGGDPAAFIAANLDGTCTLFDQAADQGVARVLFLSTRAVHDGHPPGTDLTDDLPPCPTTLYGRVKAQAEAHLAALPLTGTAIRATGIYGPGSAHKWASLIDDYRAGRPITPRMATEVHVTDLARAMALLLAHRAPPATLNCSDLVLDHHDLLAIVRDNTGCSHPLPSRADGSALRIPDCTALLKMGWKPGGLHLLRRTLAACIDQDGPSGGPGGEAPPAVAGRN